MIKNIIEVIKQDIFKFVKDWGTLIGVILFSACGGYFFMQEATNNPSNYSVLIPSESYFIIGFSLSFFFIVIIMVIIEVLIYAIINYFKSVIKRAKINT